MLKSGQPYPYTQACHQDFISLFNECSSMVSNHDIGQTPALDEFRVQRLRAQFRQISGKALIVVTEIAAASNFYTKPSLKIVTVPTKNMDTDDTMTGCVSSTSLAKHIGTPPRTVSQLISRQSWLSDEEQNGLSTLFALLRTRTVASVNQSELQPNNASNQNQGQEDDAMKPIGDTPFDASIASDSDASSVAAAGTDNAVAVGATSAVAPDASSGIRIDMGSLLRTMGQLAQALQRILLYCSHEPRDNELFATHQKVSIIIQRWIKDYTIGKENELYTESVTLSTFKEEERDFKAHMSRLKHRWRTQQKRLLLSCFEADHLFCLLVTLDRRFLMQHAVSEDERRLFIATTDKLSKLQQHHNEHVAVELPRWRSIVNEGVVFKEGSLLYTSSVNMERALQRRVAAEICNMSFIVLSATYAVVIGGHLNQSIKGFGPVYTPSWWPSIWFGHSVLILLVFAAIAWNWFSLDTIVGGSKYAEGTVSAGGALVVGSIRPLHDTKNQPLVLQYYYWCLTSIGTSRGTALLVLIIGLLSLVTMMVTICILRGIGIIMALS